jgi:iron complex transport system substrate-binding protein
LASSTKTRRPAASAAFLLTLSFFLTVQAAPQRVVSINLCTDQLLLQLARPEQIASVSFLATDPALSVYSAAAAAFPRNRGSAEEVLALRPDLVLAESTASLVTVSLLRQAGLVVWQLVPPSDIAGIELATRDAGRVLDRESVAEGAIRAMRETLKAIEADAPRQPRGAIALYPNAWTTGGGTLADAALRAAGLANKAAATGYNAFSIEGVLKAAPDILVFPREQTPSYSQAAAMLDHPALRVRWAVNRRVALPGNLLICGGTFFADAVRRLAEGIKGQ